MKRLILQFAMLGLLVTSLEGAADAVRVHDGAGESGLHEMHHPHHEDSAPGSETQDGEPADVHACHCTAHTPPLAFRLTVPASAPLHEREAVAPSLRIRPGGPPPLPPPIV